MKDLLKFSTGRIYNLQNEVVGAGFLVSKSHLITCAHVVNDAIGLPKGSVAKPTETISLDFPFVAKVGRITAKVVRWRAPNFGPKSAENDEEDVAVLLLDLKAGDEAVLHWVRPKPRARVWNHPFRAFGFPASYDEGVYASGKLKDRQANNWIQIEAENSLGYFVAPGFSGTAVEELRRFRGGVVGMVVASDSTPGKGSAFIIPADTLLRICDGIIEPPFWKRHATKLILGVLAVALVAAFAAYKIWIPSKPTKTASPTESFNDWSDPFTKAQKLEDHWQYPKGIWTTEPGERATNKVEGLPVDNDDEALLVRGQEMGIPSDLGGKVFRNFRAVFRVRFKNGGQRIAWVLRAQPDRAGGYIFELVREGGHLFLYSWIYEQKQKTEQLGSKKEIPFGKFRESQSWLIDVIVQDNKFDYNIKFSDDLGNDPNELAPKSGEAVVKNLEITDDPNNIRWPWGTIGFLVTDDSSVMRVESVYVYPAKP